MMPPKPWPKPEAAREPETEVSRADADAALAHAAKLYVEAGDKVRVADIVEGGAAVGLTPEQVQAGFKAVVAQRMEVEEQKRRNAHLVYLGAKGFALLMGIVILAYMIWTFAVISRANSLQGTYAQVELARAQVRSQLDRQRETEAHFLNAVETPERNAEIAGSTNRVSIARTRYNTAAAAYNEDARGTLGSRAVARAGLPARVSLSNEVRSW